MDARKTVPTVAVCQTSDRANREDPPTHFIFIFVFLIFYLFCYFLPCFVLTSAIFLTVFFCIFYVYNFWDARYTKKKGKRGIFS